MVSAVSQYGVGKMPPKPNGILQTWKAFRESTSSHGIPQVHRATGAFKRTLWSTILTGCFAFLIYHLTSVTIQYLSYKVDVVVELAQSRELEFPAVTICNMNPIRVSALHDNPILQAALFDIIKVKTENMTTTTTTGTPVTPVVRQKDIFVMQEKVLETLSVVPDSVKMKLGHAKNQFIVDCEFAGYDCDISKIVEFYDTVHGRCFIFNSGWLPGEPLKISHRAGRRYGLKIIINIQQYEYMDHLGESAGARIVILPQYHMPFPQDEGIMAKSGELASIGVNQVVVERMEDPYGDCTDKASKNLTRNIYEEVFPVNYTSTACFKTCYQKHLVEMCNCADPHIPASGSAFSDKQYSPCTLGTQQETCRKNVDKLYKAKQINCHCPNPCYEKKYVAQVSNNVWPSQAHEDELRALVRANEKTQGNLDSNLFNNSWEMKRNLLQIEVYFEDFNHEYISEKPSYPVENFISDLGGILGLWVGCSVVSLFEFVELFISILAVIASKLVGPCKGKRHTKPQNTVSADDKHHLRSPPPPYAVNWSNADTFAPALPVPSHNTLLQPINTYKRNMEYLK